MADEFPFALRLRRAGRQLTTRYQMAYIGAAIAATGKSLYAIAQASGVAAPVLQRFVNGKRGITLETAGKLAAYLGLALWPDPSASGSQQTAAL